MTESDKSDIVCLSTDNVQIHVHRPNRCVMTASTFTNEVGLVSYRLDVACENQQVCSKQKPKGVTRIDNTTLRELRERWEVFYLETVKTVVVGRTLHKSGVASALPNSLTADQSWEIRETVDDKQVQERDNIERYDLLVNDAVDGGIETSECHLPSSPEKPSRHEPTSESVAAVAASDVNVSHNLDVACENQQVFSRQQPKSVIRIDNITLHELKERWEVFYLETVKTVVVGRTLHKSGVASALPDSLTADREPGRSVEADYSQTLSDSDISDLSKLHVSTKNDTATATGVCTDAQAVETDSGLSSLTVISLDDQKMTDYDQLQEHKKVPLSDLSRNDNRSDDSGIQTSHRGLPLSAEESSSQSDTHDHHQPVAVDMPLWPSDNETAMHKPCDDRTGVDTVDTRADDDYRLYTRLPGVDRVDTQTSHDDRLDTERHDDETDMDRVVTQRGGDDRLVTQPREDETFVDRMVTQPGDDDRLDTEPHYDDTVVDRVITHPGDDDTLVTERRGDETGVDRIVTQRGVDDRLVTEHRGDETGVVRVVTQRGVDDRLDTERPGDETGVDRVVTQPGDDVLMSESGDRVIHAANKPALEDMSGAIETSSRSLASGITAEVVGVEYTAPEEYLGLVEICEVSSSEMSKDRIRKPVAAVDATSLKLSEPEALSEFEHEYGRSETAATGPEESLAINVSDDVVAHQKPLSEVRVFTVYHSDCIHISFVHCMALLLPVKSCLCACLCVHVK